MHDMIQLKNLEYIKIIYIIKILINNFSIILIFLIESDFKIILLLIINIDYIYIRNIHFKSSGLVHIRVI